MRISHAGVAAALLATLTSPLPAQGEEPAGYFDGQYLGVTNFGYSSGFGFNIGYASGIATYHFLTDGYYNSAPDQTFTVGLPINEEGAPLGIFFGRNRQTGNRVVGFEAYFHTAGVRADDFNSPDYISTGNHSYDIKPHWITALSATAGIAFGRVMLYAQLGPMIGHPVAQIDDLDNNLRIWTARAVPGITASVGFQVAVTRFLSVGIGYRAYALAPVHITGPSIDRDTGLPVPGTETDHTIQISEQSVTARMVIHFGNSERAESWPARFEWGGPYIGAYVGALHQVGGQFGYDWMRGDTLYGVSLQAGIGICCGISIDVAASARIGRLVWNDILAYAEVTGAFQTGTFFDVIDGPYFGAGIGIEMPLTRRVTSFMEAKLLGAPGFGFGDIYFQGGFNIQLGHRNDRR